MLATVSNGNAWSKFYSSLSPHYHSMILSIIKSSVTKQNKQMFIVITMRISETEYDVNSSSSQVKVHHTEVTVLSTKLYILASKYLHRRGRIISCGSWEATDGAGSSLDDCVSSSWPDESFMVSSLHIKKANGTSAIPCMRQTLLWQYFFPKLSIYQTQIYFIWLEVTV